LCFLALGYGYTSQKIEKLLRHLEGDNIGPWSTANSIFEGPIKLPEVQPQGLSAGNSKVTVGRHMEAFPTPLDRPSLDSVNTTTVSPPAVPASTRGGRLWHLRLRLEA